MVEESGPIDMSGFINRWPGFRLRGNGKVLLREPERCDECSKVFISLYPIAACDDHQCLDEV